jgi:hypothetical protein
MSTLREPMSTSSLMSFALDSNLPPLMQSTCGEWERINNSFDTFESSPWPHLLLLPQPHGSLQSSTSLQASLTEVSQRWSILWSGTSSASHPSI